ncbi:hypothetical protein SCG7086_AE_00180 [Chlamydiales bacterium SCGC AG-110-P3]|nr:hypothetical protein SCG7086_AE_00180 [Chlamydiales bacterium SCGC AG-110-P3]
MGKYYLVNNDKFFSPQHKLFDLTVYRNTIKDNQKKEALCRVTNQSLYT